jgi:hypothetical protein
VEVIEGALADIDLPEVDAALLCLVPWVLNDEEALRRLLARLRGRGRIAVLAEKAPPRWNLTSRAWVRFASPKFGVSRKDLDRPWLTLTELLPFLKVKSTGLGAFFYAWGDVERKK